MVWGRKDSKGSNGPVTVAYLVERQVLLGWQEAVAITLEVAEMTERSGKGAVPQHQNIELKAGGAIAFLRGRVQSGDPVSALAMTLNALLGRDRPAKLRLLVSTAGPGSSTYKSVGEFIEALKYFDRPGRQDILSEVYRRALEPAASPVSPEPDAAASKKREKRPMTAAQRWAVAAVAVLAVGAGGFVMTEKTSPGMITDRVSSWQATATDWWAKAMDATEEVRAAASEDFSMVVERMEEVRTDLTADTGLADGEADAGDDTETPEPAAASTTPRTRPTPSPVSTPVPAEPEPDEDDSAAAEPEMPEATLVAGLEAADNRDAYLRSSDSVVVSSALFDSTDTHVTPPMTKRVQLPEIAAGTTSSGQIGVLEAIVSASGEVETVKLLTSSPPSSVHQAMLLSAIKTWRFQPAQKDGNAVRYRHRIEVAIPRCQTRACS